MEKIKELLKNKKFYLALGIVGAVILIILIIKLIGGKETYQEGLEKQLKKMGTDFYELYYYDRINDDEAKRSEFLEKYKSIGIKIDLDNLSRYNSEKNKDIAAGFKNHITGKECDNKQTQVVIFPKSPYGKNDYEIETILVCGYDEKDTENVE